MAAGGRDLGDDDAADGEITRRIPAGILELLRGREQAGSGSGGVLTRIGRALMRGLLSGGVALILAIYLLVDGRRTSEWLVAFFPRRAAAPRP